MPLPSNCLNIQYAKCTRKYLKCVCECTKIAHAIVQCVYASDLKSICQYLMSV